MFLFFFFSLLFIVFLSLYRIYQFAMPGLFSVIKYIWHDDAPLALLKNTLSLRSQRNFRRWAFLCIKTPSKWPVSTERIWMRAKHISIIILKSNRCHSMRLLNYTSIALLPQPIIWPVPMYATDVGISPHWNEKQITFPFKLIYNDDVEHSIRIQIITCSTIFLDTLPWVLT